MKPNPQVIVDIIGDIVNKTNTAVIGTLKAADNTIRAINYQYGPPLEIYNTIAEMSAAKQSYKYPLFALFQPFDQDKGKVNGIDSVTRLRIVIARWKKENEKAKDSYSRNFKPILYPVYAEFLYQCSVHKSIATTTWEQIPHKQKDWPYWDNDGKNVMVDRVDIIELSNLELNFRLKNC